MLDTFLGLERTAIPEQQIFVRLLFAVGLSAVLGLDREIRDHAAGLRTHMLTALAAALFTIVTFEIAHHLDRLGNNVNADPLRVIEAVTAGVAFLAAGAIIRAGPKEVRGLTTGASMWLAGAIGLACGAGYLTVAAMGLVLALIILTLLKWFEKNVLGKDS